MDFEQLIEMLRNPGDDGLPDSIYDDLGESYNAMSTGAAAKIADLETALQAKEMQISNLKAHNYDLLTATAANDPEAEADENAEQEKADESDTIGVDDLFEDED